MPANGEGYAAIRPKGWHPGATVQEAEAIERLNFERVCNEWNRARERGEKERAVPLLRDLQEAWLSWNIAKDEARTGRLRSAASLAASAHWKGWKAKGGMWLKKKRGKPSSGGS